jgi:hypothetical protein
MPIFVWHLSAYCVFFAAATAVGVDNSTVDGDWWAQRPLWFAGPALVYAGGVALRSRAVASARQHLTEQHRASSRDPSARW